MRSAWYCNAYKNKLSTQRHMEQRQNLIKRYLVFENDHMSPGYVGIFYAYTNKLSILYKYPALNCCFFFNLNNELRILSTDVTITFLLIKDIFYRTVSGMNWTSYLYISKLSIYWYLKYLIVEPKINNYKYNKRWYTYSSHHFNRQDYFMTWIQLHVVHVN